MSDLIFIKAVWILLSLIYLCMSIYFIIRNINLLFIISWLQVKTKTDREQKTRRNYKFQGLKTPNNVIMTRG